MYSLTAPTRNYLQDFDDVVARRRLHTRILLQHCRKDIENAYTDYQMRSGNDRYLRPIPVTEAVSTALKGNYAALSKGNHYAFLRDAILGSAHFDACPYCNIAPVDTLDHVLPKSTYPEFSILALNLVPACSLCNLKKGGACFIKSGTKIMHPYFVHMPTDPILFADVFVDHKAVTWSFYLQNNGVIANVEFSAIETLFSLLDLADRFHGFSVGDIMDRVGHFDVMYQSGGTVALREYLEQESNSSQHNRGANYWKTAILRALAESDSFCQGGYQRL